MRNEAKKWFIFSSDGRRMAPHGSLIGQCDGGKHHGEKGSARQTLLNISSRLLVDCNDPITHTHAFTAEVTGKLEVGAEILLRISRESEKQSNGFSRASNQASIAKIETGTEILVWISREFGRTMEWLLVGE